MIVEKLILDVDACYSQDKVKTRVGELGRTLEIRLTKGGIPFPIEPSMLAIFTAQKPDGTILYNHCDIREGAAYYPFTAETTSCPTKEGWAYPAELRVYDREGKDLTSASFLMEVAAHTVENGEILSKTEKTALTDLVGATQKVKNETQALRESLQQKLDGGDLEGESAYETAVRLGYQGTEQQWLESLRYDHSEEFTTLAAQVRQDRDAAGQSASTASGFAADAENQARQAAESARQAGEAETQAADSAASAAGSAQAAEASALRAEEAAEKNPLIIDDEVVSREKTRSSLKLYDTLCPPFEATGPVVSCHPVADYPLHVVSEIAVKQEGSGDPSPTNVRPIVATKKVELVRCGENIAPVDALKTNPATVNGYTFAFVRQNLFREGLNCTVSFDTENTGVTCIINPETGFLAHEFVMDGKRKMFTQILSEVKPPLADGTVRFCTKNDSNDTPTGIIRNLCISYSDTSGVFYPYAGQVITAQLPPDTYGGEVDWETGEVSPYISGIIDPTVLVVGTHSSGVKYASMQIPWSMMGTKIHCSQYTTGDYNISKRNYLYCPADGGVVINDDRFTDIETASKLIKAEKPFTVFEKLKHKEAITPSGTPKALPGMNTLYSDTGDTTVSGREDPVYNAQKTEERITALENLITQKTGGM